jgi:hypothetical protein
MREKTKTILLVLGVLALLAYLGMHVKAAPHPEQVVLIKTGGAACSSSFSELLKKEPGVVGIASVAGTGEFHVGINRETSIDVVRRKLLDAAVPATFVGTMSPVEYRKVYGHYFKSGTFVTCEGGCEK